MYTLYASPRACSMAPHIVLEELEVRYKVSYVVIAEGATQTEEYTKINPHQRVPALETEWGVLTEVSAILFFLSEQHSAYNLTPPVNTPSRARMYEMFSWLSTALHATGYAGLWRPERFHPKAELVAKDMSKTAHHTIEQANREIEAGLNGQYVLGDQYTILDPYLYVFFLWAHRIGIEVKSRYPKWTAWAERMEKRHAVQKMLSDEHIEGYFSKPVS